MMAATGGEQPQPSYVLRGHDSVVHSVGFAGRSNELLLAGDQAGNIKAWSLANRRPTASWTASTFGKMPVLAVCELDDGRWLSHCKDGTITVWSAERACGGNEIEGGKAEASISVELHSFCKCEVIDTHTVAVPVGEGVECGLWDTRTSTIKAHFSPMKCPQATSHGPRGPTGMCMSLAAAGPDELVGGYEDGSLHLWDLRSMRPLHATKPHTEPVFGLSASMMPSRRSEVRSAVCASGGADAMLVINTWDMHTDQREESDGQDKRDSGVVNTSQTFEDAAGRGEKEEGRGGGKGMSWEEKGRFEVKGEGSKGVSTVHVRPDAKIIAAGCWDGRVRLYSVKKPRVLASMACHSKGVQCVRFSRDSTLLASSSDDTRIAVWQVYPPS